MVVRTLKKSASRFSMARAEVMDSTAGSDSSHDRRIVVFLGWRTRKVMLKGLAMIRSDRRALAMQAGENDGG
jgi:hypothetical protein